MKAFAMGPVVFFFSIYVKLQINGVMKWQDNLEIQEQLKFYSSKKCQMLFFALYMLYPQSNKCMTL